MSLRLQSFVVVDTETTGTDPTEDRIIEIGAVLVKDGRVAERFEQLIDPGRPIPRSITRLTGITDSMVTGKVNIEEGIRRFISFAGDTPLVAHNAGFDHRFLALEALRTGAGSFEAPFLCTLRLARRLLPGLPSKGLDSLRKFYGFTIERRHRALDDAELAGKVLLRLLPHAETAGARDLDALRQLQVGHYATSGAVTRRLERLRKERISSAPKVPGVYRFFDGKRRLLYVGKARSLRDRLRQYVVAVEALPPRTRRMMGRVHDCSWETFPTELEAMLHESRLIKSEQPPHNRAQRTYRRRPFLRLWEDQLALRTVIRRDEAAYYGPIGSAALARVLAEVLVACFGRTYANRPTVRTPLDRERLEHRLRASGWVAQSSVEVGSEGDFLKGRVGMVVERLQSAMQDASQGLDFEAAGTIRDWMETVQSRAGRTAGLAPRVFDRDAVLVARPAGRAPELAALHGGLPAAFANQMGELKRVIDAAVAWGVKDRLSEVEAEDAHVVAHWSHLHRRHLLAVERLPGEAEEAFSRRVILELGERLPEPQSAT